MTEAIGAVLDRIERQQQVHVGDKATPLDFLQAVYCNAALPLHTRMKAAVEAAPYVHPKLSATAVLQGGDFAMRLEAAIKRSKTVVEVSAVAQIEGPASALEHQSAPSDRRFRRG